MAFTLCLISLVVLSGSVIFVLFHLAVFESDYFIQQEDVSYREFYDSLALAGSILSRAREKEACNPNNAPPGMILEVNDQVVLNAILSRELSLNTCIEEKNGVHTLVLIEGGNETEELSLAGYIKEIIHSPKLWEDEPEVGSDESTFFSSARTFEEEEEMEDWELMFAPTESSWALEGGM